RAGWIPAYAGMTLLPVLLGAMVIRERDAENTIGAEPGGQALDQSLAFDGLLARAGQPRRLARQVRQQRIGAQLERVRGRRQREASELFATDGEDEIGPALGRR